MDLTITDNSLSRSKAKLLEAAGATIQLVDPDKVDLALDSSEALANQKPSRNNSRPFAKEEILGEASLFRMNTTFFLQDPDSFRQRSFVAGRWCDADSGATLEVNNPATGEILGTVPKMGANETWRAIEAAKDAFIDWSRKPAKERSVLMRRWHDLIMANLDDLGALMTAEQGKPLTEAKGEVAYAASFIEWFAEEAKRVYGDTIVPNLFWMAKLDHHRLAIRAC